MDVLSSYLWLRCRPACIAVDGRAGTSGPYSLLCIAAIGYGMLGRGRESRALLASGVVHIAPSDSAVLVRLLFGGRWTGHIAGLLSRNTRLS